MSREVLGLARAASVSVALSLAIAAPPAHAAGPAGIKLDGSLGGAAAVLLGPNYAIGQNLGKLSGGNLFFSFQYFSVATGESARFSTTSAGINNVISRVTGGYASTIDGSISLVAAHGAPDFFFINPSGVTFTANASINVPAGLYVSTADYLKFPDGNFYSSGAKQSTLSAAAPAAFGFLGTNRAPVQVLGAQLSSSLTGTPDLELVGGDINLGGATGGVDDSFGKIRLIAIGTTAIEVPLSGPVGSTNGAVNITDGAVIQSGNPAVASGGGVDVYGGSLTVDGEMSAGGAGILSFSGPSSKAGPISVAVGGIVTIQNNGALASTTSSSGNAGDISIEAASLSIDGSEGAAAIATFSMPGATGSAGNVTINVAGPVSVTSGGGIIANTFSAGNAGEILLNAQSLTMDGGAAAALTVINTSAVQGSSGAAGGISITLSGAASLANGAQILSNAAGSGNGGQVNLTANSLTISAGPSNTSTGIRSNSVSSVSGPGGDVMVDVSGSTSIIDGGQISSGTFGTGNGGAVSVQSGSLTIDGANAPAGVFTGISSDAERASSGAAGNVAVTISGAATLTNGGAISSSTAGAGKAGQVSLVVGGALSVLDGALILSDAFSSGSGGQVSVSAGSLALDGGLTDLSTDIASTSNGPHSGAAGNVSVQVAGSTSIAHGGSIDSATFGTGNGGTVHLQSGSLTIQGDSSPTFSGLATEQNANSSGTAGNIVANVSGSTTITDSGEISSNTAGSGRAGQVNLRTGSLTIDNDASTYVTGIISESGKGSGAAGDVTITVQGAAMISDGARISTSTFGSGNAGQVNLQAQSLTVDGLGNVTLIDSRAEPGATGSSGNVVVNVAGAVDLLNGGELATGSFGAGSAGQVNLQSGSLTIAGAESSIASRARAASGGQPGQVTITTGELDLDSGGRIDISNDATVSNPNAITPTQITVSAQNISMNDGTITARSTGNVAASAIDITYASAMYMDPSVISTSSKNGNGGPITISGSGPLFISHSNITTSVLGSTNGNGGNISIDAPQIVLDTGAIQANTFAPLAAGGTVSINARALVPSYESIIIGGDAVAFTPATLGLNIVQAAAPDGVNGVLNVTVPTLDLGNSLLGLTGHPAAATALGRSLCGFTRGSSLAVAGRGGLPASAYDPLWIDDDSIPASGEQRADANPPASFACR